MKHGRTGETERLDRQYTFIYFFIKLHSKMNIFLVFHHLYKKISQIISIVICKYFLSCWQMRDKLSCWHCPFFICWCANLCVRVCHTCACVCVSMHIRESKRLDWEWLNWWVCNEASLMLTDETYTVSLSHTDAHEAHTHRHTLALRRSNVTG